MINIKKINKKNIDEVLSQDGSLYILVASSHAGYVNGNRVAYIPQRTDSFAKSCVAPYDKPQLIGHVESSIPVGRVIDGFATTLIPKDKADPAILNKKSTKRINEIKALSKRLYSLDYNDARDYKYSSSVLLTVVKVSDEETISNIGKGLIKSVSIGATPNGMYCSICHKNWAKDGMCMHWPGEEDEDGKEMFFIAGELTLDEQSFVNVPADPGAKIVAVLTEEEVNNKSYKEKAMTMLDNQANKGAVAPVDKRLEDSMTKESEKIINDLKSEIEDLKSEIAGKVKSISEKDSLIDSLNTEVTTLKDSIESLANEVKEVLLLKIADSLESLGKKHDKEFVETRFNDKTVDQLRDYLEVLAIDSDEGTKDKKKAGEENNVNGNPDKEKELDKVNIEDNIDEAKKALLIPNFIKLKAAKIAASRGKSAGQKVIEDYLASIKEEEEKTGDK